MFPLASPVLSPSIPVMWPCKPRVRVAPQPAMRCRERKYEEAGDLYARHGRSRPHPALRLYSRTGAELHAIGTGTDMGRALCTSVSIVLAEGYIGPHSGAADSSLTAPPCDRSASIHIWLTQEETAL